MGRIPQKMNPKQKEIVLIPYPFTNLEGKKVRPALIISNNFFNTKSDDCIAIPITTVIKDESFSIFITQEDLNSGKLIAPSRIRADKIFTMEKGLIIKTIGSLKQETFKKIKSEILKLF